MGFRHDAPAVGAGHDAEAHIGEAQGRRFRPARTAAEPQHRAACFGDRLCQRIEIGRRGRRAQDLRCSEGRRYLDRRTLDVDRDFHADRPGRRGQRGPDRFAQHAKRLFRRPDAEKGLGDALQHGRLVGRFVDIAPAAVEPAALDLACQMQHRRAGGQRLDQAAGGIAGRHAGGGDADAEPARNPGEGIGHVERAGLAARRHEAHPVAAREGVEDRHVVDRNDAERGFHPARVEKGGDQIADRRPCQAKREAPPETSTDAPVMKAAAGEAR